VKDTITSAMIFLPLIDNLNREVPVAFLLTKPGIDSFGRGLCAFDREVDSSFSPHSFFFFFLIIAVKCIGK